ncbi:MAG: hypothetical protein ACYDBJ_27595 [Aggregatilineales bacterium]
MKTLCVSLTALLITALFGITIANSPILAASPAAAVQQSAQSNIAVQLTALQQPEGIRYSITIINSEAQALPGLYAVVAIPPGANLVQALETDGYTHFLGALPTSQGLDLSWSANFAAGDYVDAFVFTLDSAAAGNIGVNLKWGGDQPGQIEFWGQPTVIAAGLTENDLALAAAGTGDSLLPVGGTGVLVGVAPGQVPDGTTIHVRLMPTSQDPPVTNDLWWCSAVEITGLPAGAEITVLVPLREPLAPGAPVALFSRQPDGSWGQLAAEGIVTFDGQHVAYTHRGGAVATGIKTTFQPKIKLPKPISPQATTGPRPTAPRPVILTGTPTKIPNPPVRTPTPQIIRPTKLVTPFVPVTHIPATGIPPTHVPATNIPPTHAPATSIPPTHAATTSIPPTHLPASPAPPSVTATVGTKSNVVTATPAAAASCKDPGVVCFGVGGSSIISLCTRAGVNCISTGTGGAICFTVAFGGRVQCAAPGGTVIFAPGSSLPGFQLNPTATTLVKQNGPIVRTFVLAPSATPIVIIVTATFVPQPTVCVQSTSGVIACTNQNGQLIPPPTATPRADGGECFDYTEGGIFGSATFTICVDVNGVECTQPPFPVTFDPPFICLSPNEPGYITPP